VSGASAAPAPSSTITSDALIRPSFSVQHHPARSHLLSPLLGRIGECEVVSDPEPDGKRCPLRCYLECLRLTPEWATHRIVIQDDTWPCEEFREKAETAIEERPDTLVAFFVPGSPGGGRNRILHAQGRREQWAPIGGLGWVPVVALCWPTSLIAPFLDYAAHPRYASQCGDDAIVGWFSKQNRLQVWATVPSLVEHPDREPSLIGRRHFGGRNRSRLAALFAD